MAFWTWYLNELKKINPDVYTVAEVWDGDGITNRYAVCMNCFRFATSQTEGLIAATAKGGDAGRFARETQRYLDELKAIFDETGGTERIELVEKYSEKKAAEMGMTMEEYRKYTFEHCSRGHFNNEEAGI